MPSNDNVVIVLDPGHGGSNEGLSHRGLLEKDMNLVTACAMRDELLQYENVEVYITNPEKADMSLKERAQYAESVGADILISLHFNMSEKHEMFGSEVWIPSAGQNYAQMHSLGDVFMEQFHELGFTLRGVKTRLNDDGLDYYGILRESTALEIPSILVEHGYADHLRDYEKVNDEEDWQTLGRSDATAVAKYFGLTSSSLGRDYTSYVKNGYFAPEEPVGSDLTEPESALLVYVGSTEKGEIFHISGKDAESEIVYYDYTTDGGKTWSVLFPFENGKDSAQICIPDVLPGAKVIARVYNGHFLYTQTETVGFEKTDLETGAEEEQIIGEISVSEENMSVSGNTPPVMYGSLFGVVISILLIVAAFATYRERVRKRNGGHGWRMKQIENICLISGVCIFLFSVTLWGISHARERASTEPVQNIRRESTPQESVNQKLKEDEISIEMRYNHETEKKPETVVVFDIAQGLMRVPLVEGIRKNSYDMTGFQGTGLSKKYVSGDDVKSMVGIDVSKFQGEIDWQQVKEAGVEFAILRVGIRGYGTGEMKIDDRFYENCRRATEQGIRVGVYFFSAAVNEEEAVEEADFVLDAISGCVIEMPVVFDTEPIYYDDARTDDLTPNRLTSITKAFCDRIREAGYEPVIYANAKRFATVLHLEELEAYDKWLADYREAPDYPYAFKMWQFTEKGTVPGIDGYVDLDLYFYE